MQIADYHEEVRRTSSADFPHDEALKLSGLGIAGEVGEVIKLIDDVLTAEERGVPYPEESIAYIKKHIIKEAGDVLWYVIYLLNALQQRAEDLLNFDDLPDYQDFVYTYEAKNPLTLSGATRALAYRAGGVADIIKKHTLHGKELARDYLLEELAETVWNLTVILNHFEIALSLVLDTNVAKLRKRYPHGWSREASIARADENTDADDANEVRENEVV